MICGAISTGALGLRSHQRSKSKEHSTSIVSKIWIKEGDCEMPHEIDDLSEIATCWFASPMKITHYSSFTAISSIHHLFHNVSIIIIPRELRRRQNKSHCGTSICTRVHGTTDHRRPRQNGRIQGEGDLRFMYFCFPFRELRVDVFKYSSETSTGNTDRIEYCLYNFYFDVQIVRSWVVVSIIKSDLVVHLKSLNTL